MPDNPTTKQLMDKLEDLEYDSKETFRNIHSRFDGLNREVGEVKTDIKAVKVEMGEIKKRVYNGVVNSNLPLLIKFVIFPLILVLGALIGLKLTDFGL